LTQALKNLPPQQVDRLLREVERNGKEHHSVTNSQTLSSP